MNGGIHIDAPGGCGLLLAPVGICFGGGMNDRVGPNLGKEPGLFSRRGQIGPHPMDTVDGWESAATGAENRPPGKGRPAEGLTEKSAGAGDEKPFFRHGLANKVKKSDTTRGVGNPAAPFPIRSNEMPEELSELFRR